MTRHLFLAAALLLVACKGSGDKAKDTADKAKASPPKSTPTDAGARAPEADAAPMLQKDVLEFPGFIANAVGIPVEGDDRDKLTGKVKVVSTDCEGGDTDVLFATPFELDAASPGAETIAASLAHGVFVVGGDKLIASYAEAIANCDGSQTEPGGLWVGQVVADPDPEIVFIEQFGGRNMSAVTIHVYKRKADKLVEIFSTFASETEGDTTTAYKVLRQDDGRIVIDDDAKNTWAWDETAFKYAKAPAAATPPK